MYHRDNGKNSSLLQDLLQTQSLILPLLLSLLGNTTWLCDNITLSVDVLDNLLSPGINRANEQLRASATFV